MRELGLPSIVLKRRIQFGEITTNGSLAEAAPRDLMRLVVMLAREELISPAASRAMLDILGRQRYLEQAPRFIAYRPYAGDFGTVAIDPHSQQDRDDHRNACRHRPHRDRAGRRIAYSVVNDAGSDDTYREEHPGDITNALIGRVLVEYWWPGEWNPEIAVFPSPYVDALFSQAGL